MAQEVQGQVGVQAIAEGGHPEVRLDYSGATVTSRLHGYEAAVRNKIFSAHTAATGVAPGTAFGTTAAFTLFNPDASTVNLVILRGRMGYVSGTLGAGFMSWLYSAAGTDPSGTAITTQGGKLGVGTSTGLAFTTATIPANPVPIRPFCSLGASLASTAVQPWQIEDVVDGTIIVPPGAAISLHATAAAGTSPLVVLYCQWAEVAVP